jgi:tRNA A58 N-methylase Trm61
MENEYLPWYNWELIEYLNGLDLRDKAVFEYGIGHSTLYYIQKGASVSGIETRAEWMDFMLNKTDKAQVKLCQNISNFANEIEGFGQKFDIIVIDSRDRAKCLEIAPNFLNTNGFIILDNSERPNLQPAIQATLGSGFKVQKFEGLGPNRTSPSQACIFCAKKS